MIRIIFLSILVIGLGLYPFKVIAEVIRYEDLPRLILEKNYLVSAGQARVSAADARTGYLARSYLPKVEVSGGYERFGIAPTSPTTDPFWKIEASANLFRSGIDDLENSIRKLKKSVSEINLDQIKRENLFQARRLFWELLALKEFIRIQEQAITDNEKHMKAAKKRVSAGIATRSDPIEFQLEKTLLEQDLKKMNLDMDKLKNQLSILLARKSHEDLEIISGFSHPPDEELQSDKVELNQVPIIKSQTLSKDIFYKEGEKQSRYWMPQIDAYASYGRSTSREYEISSDREWILGVRLKLDLFNGLESQKEASVNRALAHASEAKALHFSLSTQATLHELYHDLKLLHELLHDADSSAKQSQSFLKLTLDEYGRGAKNGPDVLEAAKKQVSFERRLYELFRDYYITKSELLAIKGE